MKKESTLGDRIISKQARAGGWSSLWYVPNPLFHAYYVKVFASIPTLTVAAAGENEVHMKLDEFPSPHKPLASKSLT